jgi:hypothetical protein
VLIQLEKITQEGGSATAVTRARAVKILYKKTEAFGTCFFPHKMMLVMCLPRESLPVSRRDLRSEFLTVVTCACRIHGRSHWHQ